MSSTRPQTPPIHEEDEPEPKGPNLFLIYGLLAFGILLAMAFAAMIIFPFYLRR
jgi:hypothetical protein